MPGSVLSTSSAITHLILATTLWCVYYYHLSFYRCRSWVSGEVASLIPYKYLLYSTGTRTWTQVRSTQSPCPRLNATLPNPSILPVLFVAFYTITSIFLQGSASSLGFWEPELEWIPSHLCLSHRFSMFFPSILVFPKFLPSSMYHRLLNVSIVNPELLAYIPCLRPWPHHPPRLPNQKPASALHCPIPSLNTIKH